MSFKDMELFIDNLERPCCKRPIVLSSYKVLNKIIVVHVKAEHGCICKWKNYICFVNATTNDLVVATDRTVYDAK